MYNNTNKNERQRDDTNRVIPSADCVSAAQEILRVKAMESVGYLWKEHKSALIFCGAASLVWSGVTVLSEVPVYLSLLLYFLLWYLPYLRVHINGKMIQTFSMIGYLHLSSFYLMFLGAASIGRGSVRNINLQSSVKASGYLTAKIVLCIFYIIWIRYFSGKNVKEEHTDYKKSKIFLLFLWSCLVYEMIDSILASFFYDKCFCTGSHDQRQCSDSAADIFIYAP